MLGVQAAKKLVMDLQDAGCRARFVIRNRDGKYPLPPPITGPDQIARLDIRKHQRLGGILHEYERAA